MPSATVKIRRVQDGKTRFPGLHVYTIDAEPEQERPETLGLQFQTLDGWKASACDRARQMGKWVKVIWKTTQYGKTIQTVRFVEHP